MRQRKSYKLIALDAETDPFEHMCIPMPFLMGWYDGLDWVYWWGDDCAQRCGDVLKTEKFKVYAHNGGRFDYFYLMPELFDDENVKKIKMINNRISYVEFGNSKLYDSFNILPLPLAAYKKDDIDYEIFKRDQREKPQNKKKIIDYWKSDTKYLFDWVNAFLSRFGNKLTIASAAFDQIEKTGYDCKIKTSRTYDDIFRPFYFGGRTQAFKKGFHPGHYKIYDINSAYPRAMKELHPYGSKCYRIDDASKLPNKKECPMYFAQIYAVSAGALPVHIYNNHGRILRTDFPKSKEPREFFATSWEIEAGLKTGTLHIEKILTIYMHENYKSFEAFIDKFYAEKKQGKETGDKEKETFGKLIQNSGYGKFGQDGSKFREYRLVKQGSMPFTESEEMERIENNLLETEYLEYMDFQLHNYNEFGFAMWSKPDPIDSYFNVAVAASITGWVRAYLWRTINKAVDPIYCDTDSIMCASLVVNLSNELGDWKLEAETNEGLYIGGKKLYAIKTTEKDEKGDFICKVSSKGARLSYDEIVKIVRDGITIVWKNPAPTFSLKRGIHFVKREIKAT